MNERLKEMKEFVEEREWTGYHNPKNLSMSIAIESAELMEIFQWMNTDESMKIMETDEAEHVKEEIADIMLYCLSLCNTLELDPDTIIKSKLERNKIRFPVEKVKGNYF